MRHQGIGRHRLKKTVLGVLSGMLVFVVAVPAQADNIRSQQWHLNAMHAEQMWKISKGEGVTVAVIDSGVDSSLADLKGQVLEGKDFSGRPGDAHDDYSGHGTGMAALIAATGSATQGGETYGLAPAAKILPLRVQDISRSKNQAEAEKTFGQRIGPAIRYAADSEAQIISVSLASLGQPAELQSAVKYALSKGKIIFAGVGNDGELGDPVMYPAATPGVVGVAALDEKASATAESVTGPQVDLSAPGENIVAACSGGSQLCKSHGTSDATALASASAALVWAKHPDWTANQVIRVLVNTAGGPKSGDARNDFIGYGGVRPRIALKNPGDPGDPHTNPLPGPYSEKNASPNPSKKAPAVDQTAAPTTSASDDGTSAMTWTLYGLAAAGVLVAAIVVTLARSRRIARAAGDPRHSQLAPPPFDHRQY